MSESSRMVFRLVAILPGMLVFGLVMLPLTPFWLFRQTLKIPYTWTRHRYWRAWCHFIQRPSIHRDQLVFTHSPLRLGEIRLLEVRRKPNLELDIRIRHLKLEDCPEFDAISYTWGNFELQRVILIDGKWLRVAQNAYDILQERASLFKTTLLWMDCICINQTDDHEKGFQVGMMSKIYQKASRVVIWLGNSEDGAQAFSLLEDLSKRAQPIPVNHDAPAVVQGIISETEKGRAHRFAFFERFDPRFAALARLLKHDYFFRAWVIQEIVFAKAVHLRCGGSWIDWEYFSYPVMLFSDPAYYTLVGREELYRHLEEPHGGGQICSISILKEGQYLQESNNLEKPRLCDLLADIWMIKATDPRDAIYALLNLSREAGLPEFAPSYSITTVDLYVKVAQLFWSRDELLDIIYMAGIGYRPRLNTLPSWIPDWCATPMTAPMRRTRTSFYQASKGATPRTRIIDREVLSAGGVYIDKISATTLEPFAGIAEAKTVNEKLDNSIEEILRSIEAQDLASMLHEVYFNGQPREEAFWRTLIGDTMIGPSSKTDSTTHAYIGAKAFPFKGGYRRPADGDYGELFNVWRQVCNLFRALGISKRMSFEEAISKAQSSQIKDVTIAKLFQDFKEDHRYTDAFVASGSGRKFAITERGFMCLVPPLTETGDEIGIIYGMDVPFVIRRREDCPDRDADFDLVGECYVHGMMDGEALEDCKAVQMDFLLY